MDNSFTESIPIADTYQPEALDTGVSVLTKKIRDIQLEGKKAFGGRFDILDGKGKIIAKVYPSNHEEELQSSSSLPEDFAENFMEMYRMVEQTNSKVEERLT